MSGIGFSYFVGIGSNFHALCLLHVIVFDFGHENPLPCIKPHSKFRIIDTCSVWTCTFLSNRSSAFHLQYPIAGHLCISMDDPCCARDILSYIFSTSSSFIAAKPSLQLDWTMNSLIAMSNSAAWSHPTPSLNEYTELGRALAF